MLRFPIPHTDPDDLTGKTGGGGGADGDGGKKADGDGKADPNIAILTKTVSLLTEGLQKLEANQGQHGQALAAIAEHLKPKEEAAPTLEELFKDTDFDKMEKKDIVTFMLDQVNKVVDQKVADVEKKAGDRISALDASFQSTAVNAAVKELAKDNKDLFEWTPEMRVLIAENPTLTVQRALALARAENPEKAAKMVKKYAPAPKEATGRRFGLLPTSGGSKEGIGKMSQKEAALRAFDEIMGGSDLTNDDQQVM